jgi:GGDEF domain-containing protein
MYLLLEIPNIDDPTELRLAALFCDYLLSALYAAGYREELERQARYDWLTGLGNRRALERRLADGLPSDWGLAFLDLDNLKIVTHLTQI